MWIEKIHDDIVFPGVLFKLKKYEPFIDFDAAKFKTRFACEVKGFKGEDFIEKKELRKYDLYTQYAIVATEEAIKDAGLDFAAMSQEARYDVGVIWGTGNGGIGTFEEQLQEFQQRPIH